MRKVYKLSRFPDARRLIDIRTWAEWGICYRNGRLLVAIGWPFQTRWYEIANAGVDWQDITPGRAFGIVYLVVDEVINYYSHLRCECVTSNEVTITYKKLYIYDKTL